MIWRLLQGDILDVPADVLICSANVYLTMSGGVGGAFLLRYGPLMQTELQRYLADRGLRHAERGDVVEMPTCGSPYKAVLHAVAVDGFYESSAEVIGELVTKCLRQAAAIGAHSVALSGLAMGYGRLPVTEFAEGLRRVLGQAFRPVEEVTLALQSNLDVDELRERIPSLAAG